MKLKHVCVVVKFRQSTLLVSPSIRRMLAVQVGLKSQ